MRRWVALAILSVAASSISSSSTAQRPRRPRVIQLDDMHSHGLPPPLLLYVGDPRRGDPAQVPPIELQNASGPDTLAELEQRFQRLAEVPRWRAFSLMGRLHTAVRSGSRELPHAIMRELMALRSPSGMRDAAIEVFAHALIERDADGDGNDDLAADETPISSTRLPDMPHADQIAWRALELMIDAAQYQDVQRALDTFQTRWPFVRGRERDDMRAYALHANNELFDLLAHLRAAEGRCQNAACRTHFRGRLRALLVAGLRECHRGEVDRALVRTCMSRALEAESLVTPDTPADQRADIAATITWAASELQTPTGNRPPTMQTSSPPPELYTPRSLHASRDPVWRMLAQQRLDPIRRCGPRQGGAIRLVLRSAPDGAVSVEDASSARSCLERAFAGLRGRRPDEPPAYGALWIIYARSTMTH